MGRPRRVDVGGLVYHTLNRASAGATLFEAPSDYRQFEDVLQDAVRRTAMRLLAYCVMPNTGTWCCGPSGTASSAAS